MENPAELLKGCWLPSGLLQRILDNDARAIIGNMQERPVCVDETCYSWEVGMMGCFAAGLPLCAWASECNLLCCCVTHSAAYFQCADGRADP
jgi:hypothetical protein